MDIEMFGKLSDAFGPSGFEEDVIRTIADYCKEFDVENDAMNNLYVRMPGTKQDSRPVIQLDAHLDACGFMVQNIQDNGGLGIIMLGGFHLTSLPAHAVWIRTRSGKMVHGIICAKEDLEAASAMAANVIRALDEEKIRHICHQDVL